MIEPGQLHKPADKPRFALLPNPMSSASLVAVWLLLVNTVSLRLVLLGIAFGVLMPLFSHQFLPVGPQIRSWGALVRFTPVFLFDLVVANLTVAWTIVRFGHHPRSAWLEIPLDVTDPFGITALASVISLTPGTVSSRLSADRRTLWVHALETSDPDAEIAAIKLRYEQPMREIFEG